MSGTPSTIATAAANTAFRGITFSPVASAITVSSSSLSGFNYTGSGPSASQSVTVTGAGLTGSITITAPTNYQISTDDVTFSSSVSISPSPSTVVYIRLKAGLAAGTYNNEKFTLTTANAYDKFIFCSGGVLPAVSLSVSSSSASESAATVVTVTATATNPMISTETVSLAVSGTGITAGDYNLSNSTITILNGQSSGSVTFTVVNDNLNEGTETATLTISSPSAGIVLGSIVSQNISIADDDDAIQLLTLNTPNSTITFNDLANTGTTNSLTIKGTYLLETGTGANLVYAANDGSSNSGNTYSYGTGTNSDRALGSLASGSLAPVYFGLKISNTTGTTINAMDLDYWGEQWRNGGNVSPDILYFEYSTDATSLSTGTWNTVNTLNVVSLQNTASITAIDGNNAANRSNITGTLGLGNIANNGTFWIRWRDMNQPGNDHGLGIDDVVLTPRFIVPAIFYSKSTGDMNDTGTWGDNIDGSGNSPANFSADGQVFNIFNRKVNPAIIGANWSVSGNLSRVVIGRTGVDTSSFIVQSALTFSGKIDTVAQLCAFTNNSPTSSPTFGNLIHPTSTITYGAASGTQNIDAISFGNLTLSGAGIKNFTGNTTVTGNLILDNATLDKTAAGFASIAYAGDISIPNPCTYNTGYKNNVSLATTGNGNQTISGFGNTLEASQFNSTKTAGSLTLSTSGGPTNVTTKDDMKFNFSGTALFTDNGNTLSVGGDFESDGVSGGYNLTGTLVMKGTTTVAGAAHIRLNGTSGAGVAPIAVLNNVIIDVNTPTVVDQINFQPITGGSTNAVISGNLTMQGNAPLTNGVRFGSNSTTAVRLNGDFSSSRATSAVYALSGCLEFNGASPQTFISAATAGETFSSVVLNNASGLTLSAGDMSINGNLNCSNGNIQTGTNKVVLTSAGTITETLSSSVIGLVESTRGLTNTLNTFGGMGFEISNAGPATNNTTVLRQTDAGAITTAGCNGVSVLRKFTVTPTNNSLANATTVYRYSGSAAELNGLSENFLNLFDDSGNLISNLASLNTIQNSITISNRTSIAGTYVAAVAGPVLGSFGLSDTYICTDSTTNINLTGLLQSGTFQINYTINNDPQATQTITASVGGTASFATPNLTTANNGQELKLTSIFQAGSGCPALSLTNAATLDIRSRPSVTIDANDFVCELQTAPIEFNLTGNSPWNINYTYTDVSTTAVPVTNQTTSPYAISFSPPFPRLSPARVYNIKRVVDVNGCYAKASDLASLTMDVPVPCSINWNGTVSGDWNNANNWTPNNSAPSEKTSVIIGAGPNQPNISSAVPAAVCAGAVFLNGAAPVIGAGLSITIRGDLSGTGGNTFSGDGKVILGGVGLQKITGTVKLGNVDFANTSTSGVSIQPGALLEILPGATASFLPNSKFTNNGDFVLASSASGTARIAAIPTNAIITAGAITMERWLPHGSGAGSWYFLGTPFSGKNFTDLSDDFRVCGPETGFGSQGSGILPSNEPERYTIFGYNEPLNNTRLDTAQKNGWQAPGNELLIPGRGYRTYINYYSNSLHKFDTKGALFRNDFTFPLTRTVNPSCVPSNFNCDLNLNGWNLLANPYPCPINWDAAGGWEKPNSGGNVMNNAFYTWNSLAGGYLAYNGSGATNLGVTANVSADASIIPSSQGFFVKMIAGTGANLVVKEAAKVTNTSGTYVRTAVSDAASVRMRLKKAGQTDYQFDAMVKFEEGSSDAFDNHRDMDLLSGPSFEFGFPNAEQNLLLNSQAELGTETRIVPLQMNLKGMNGEFSFEILNQNLPAGAAAYIRDNYNNEISEINQGSIIVFEVNSAEEGIADRFELIINPSSITSGSAKIGAGLVSIFPNPSDGTKGVQISLKGFNKNSASIRVTDVLGRPVKDFGIMLSNGSQNLFLETKHLSPGVYTIQVEADGKSITRKLVIR